LILIKADKLMSVLIFFISTAFLENDCKSYNTSFEKLVIKTHLENYCVLLLKFKKI
jgi:hypothetical protein